MFAPSAPPSRGKISASSKKSALTKLEGAMGRYQTFPNNPGAADSAGKLASLLLPPLAGKAFLDVGCNEGFFCGYASFEAASKVVGIDKDESSIKLAKERFPYCDFRQGDWENLDTLLGVKEKFDVILLASALHYAKDQPALIKSLMERLKPDGTLALEIGVVEDAAGAGAPPISDGWHEVKRSIDSRSFPDWKGIERLFAPYAYKHCGKSVAQIGDPLPRHVFHLQNLKPSAILLAGPTASGKSTLARELSKTFKVIKGDALLCQISADSGSYGGLGEIVKNINPQRIDIAARKVCENGGLEPFAELIKEMAGGKSFVYDGFIPLEYIDLFAALLEMRGFRVCRLETPAPALDPDTLSKRSRVEARKYQMFLSALESARKMRGGVN